MKHLILTFACASFVLNISFAQFFKKDESFAHTFSIVARDPQTGEMAVGVQGHWFSVGTAVPWGEPGLGGVGRQTVVNER